MSDKLEHGILGNIHEEKEATKGYKDLAKVAKKAHKPKLSKLFNHIAREEAHHRRELQKALKQVEHT